MDRVDCKIEHSHALIAEGESVAGFGIEDFCDQCHIGATDFRSRGGEEKVQEAVHRARG